MRKKKEKKENKMSLRETFRNFGYATKLMLKIYPSKFAAQILFAVLNPVISFFSFTYILRYITNGLQESKPVTRLIGYVLIMLIINIIFGVLTEIYECVIGPVIDKKCEVRLSKTIFKKSIEADLANYEDPAAYALYNRATTNGADAISATMNFMKNVIWVGIDLALTSWLVLLIDPVLFIFALMPAVFNMLNVKVYRLYYDYNVKEKEINRKKDYTRRSFYLSEYAKEIRLTNIHRVMQKRFAESIRELLALIRKDGVRKASLDFLVAFGTDVVASSGGQLYALYCTLIRGTMMIGDCLVVFNSLDGIMYSVQSISNFASWFTDISLKIQDYRSFITSEPKVDPNPDGDDPVTGDIVLNNVSFRYDGADEDTLHNISISIKKGERIAIVGHNGAGKTTLVKLLMRLYDPTGGEILMNGKNIREYKLREYRRTYGVVFQDYKQMSLSVAENVLGRPYTDADEELVVDSLKKAGVWDKISEQPDGIHTIMTREFDQDGLVLSGGQSQKLAIASVFAGNAGTVILDEPSSALDPIAENEMYENMMEASRGKTMIFISHRLSSAVSSDRIFLMEGGEVKESGSHAELMKLNGKYAEMFRIQAQNYTDNVNEGGVTDE